MLYALLYLEFIKLKFMGIAEYRKAFILGGIAQFASYGAEFMLIWVLIDRFESINGWGTYEVLLLYALNLASYAMAAFFLFMPCIQLPNLIKNGVFDEVLTKPLNSFLYLVCREVNPAYYSHLLVSFVVMGICFDKLNISFSWGNLLFLVATLIGGALIQASGLIFTAVPSFWIVETQWLQSLAFFELRNFIKYPISVYNKLIQVVLTFVFPYAFINFFPVQYFLQKNDFMMFHPVFQYLCPVVGFVLIMLAMKFWKFGIKHYASTGS